VLPPAENDILAILLPQFRTQGFRAINLGEMILMQNVKCWLMRIFAFGLGAIALLLAPAGSHAQNATTQTLEATIVPLGALFTVSSPLVLTKTDATFNGFTGTMTLSYRARTSQGTGQGTITVKATADFMPAGGPSIVHPPSPGDKFTYTCSGASLGNSCSGIQTVSTTAATNVVSIGASACTGGGAPCSMANPNTASVTFALTDDPAYRTGSYSATLTWTISAS
jgi:hypothetical protein